MKIYKSQLKQMVRQIVKEQIYDETNILDSDVLPEQDELTRIAADLTMRFVPRIVQKVVNLYSQNKKLCKESSNCYKNLYRKLR